MADCNETLHELFTFLDGEVGESTRRQIQAHLDSCMDCLQVFDFHAELRHIVAHKCRDEVPPSLVDRIAKCFGPEAAADLSDPIDDPFV